MDAETPPCWLGKIYDDHAENLFRYFLGSTRDVADAKDLLQDLFVKVAGFRLVSTLMGSKFFTIALTGIGLMVSLGAIVAAYEGSRSKSRMEKLTAMLKADGIELTIESILPEPVPDDQNFMATPSLHGIEIPEAMDPEGIYAAKRARLESVPRMHFDDERDFAELTYDADPATGVDARLGDLEGNPLENFMMITGAYEDLIDELVSVKDRRYSQPSTTIVERLESGKSLYDLSLPHFSQMQNVARLVSCRGTAEAKLGNPDAFLDMAQVLLKLGEGAANDGTLIGSLVQNAMLSVLLKDLEALIEERVFADEQLVRIAELIDRLDSLGCAERAFHYEMVYGAAVMDEFLESPKGSEKRAQAVNRHQNPSGEPSHFAWVVSYLVPDSLIRQNKATTIDWNYRLVFKPLKERDWEAIRKAASAVDAEVYSASWSPYAIFAKQAVPTVSGILEHVVSTEARRKMAVVAIDLERYRLANNSYPETIDLSDDDVLEGLPLRYERSVDGNDFLLYCDGWNNEDDHGDDGLDWVW